MIPPLNDPRWKDLMTGKTPHQFKMASAAMCVARNQRRALQDPSPANMESCVAEVHSFFQKFEGILGEELKSLFN